ncbi:MAG: class I SAM-dependent methyltransferase [Deltaproteobacteria bacterium]|nr:class I SAM-dependent methyltransferase [Deltaproteobacteria bacterium]
MISKDRLLEENKKYFDEFSSIYHRRRREKFSGDFAGQLVAQYEKVLDGPFPKAEALLDMGCGVGKVMLNLKLAGAADNIYGIDISGGMLGECRSNSGATGGDARLSQGNVESLPFCDGAFDVVIGHAFLHHIPDVGKVFSEAYRVLKPGGVCIFTEPSRTGSRITMTVQRAIWLLPWLVLKAVRKSDHVNIELHTYTPSDHEALALKGGFEKDSTASYAGFISRIFYWALDPVAQIVPFPPLLRAIDSVTGLLYRLDEAVFKRFIPKGWFDEIAIAARKGNVKSNMKKEKEK